MVTITMCTLESLIAYRLKDYNQDAVYFGLRCTCCHWCIAVAKSYRSVGKARSQHVEALQNGRVLQELVDWIENITFFSAAWLRVKPAFLHSSMMLISYTFPLSQVDRVIV